MPDIDQESPGSRGHPPLMVTGAVDALRESEARYRGLFEHMRSGLAYCRMLYEDGRPYDFIYISVNPAFENLTGLTNAAGKRVSELIPGIYRDNPELFDIYGRVASGGPPEQFDTFLPGLNAWFSVAVYSPQHEYFVAIFENVTGRKHAEEVLLASEARYRGLFDNMLNGLALCRMVYEDGLAVDYIHIAVNHAFTQLTGLQDPVGKSIIELIPGIRNDNPDLFEIYGRVAAGGKPEQFETYVPGLDKWYAISVYCPEPGYFVPIFEDVTARKRAEHALRESEERHRLISGLISDYVYAGVVLPDGSARTEWISGAFEQITGYTPEEIISYPGGFGALLLPDDLEKVIENQPMLRAGLDVVTEFRIRTRDGEIRWLQDSMKPHSPEPGNQGIRIIGAVQDITARKRAEQALLESEERHRTVAGLISDYVYAGILHPDGYEETEWISGAFERITGYTPEEVMRGPNRFATLIHPDDLPHMDENQARLRSGQAVVMEYRIITRGGETRWLRDSMQPYALGRPGESLRVVGAVEDITTRKQAEQALMEAHNLLEERVRQRTIEVQDLYDNAPAGYHSLDTNGVFLMMNQTELNWLGYRREEIVGRMNVRDLLTPASRVVFAENFPRFKASGRLEDLELEFTCKDGHILIVSVQATAIYDISGNYLMSRTTVFDITRRKQAEEALRISEARLRQSRDELSMANAALERAARMKDEFLASMSHELRTPLTGILGFSEILQQSSYGPLNEKQTQAVANIENSGRHLLDLINDILDLSKIEMDKLELQVEPCSLLEICQASLLLTRGMAHKKNQPVSFTPPPANTLINADPRRLKQMLVNLLSNAVKFTPDGGALGLEASVDPEAGAVCLSVWDHGIGIRSEDLPRLFQPFVQLDSSLSRQHAGTGLGLALVQRMARLHGGSMEVHSTPGQGSRFTIRLPWSARVQIAKPAAARQVEALPPPPAATGALVLLVDDNEITLEATGDYLENRGFRVVKARHGQELLDLLEEHTPAVILMDIQMPGMDGLQATRHVRGHPNPQLSRVPIIALTALAMPGDEERCLQAGANLYLSKPVRMGTLLENIQRLLAHSQ